MDWMAKFWQRKRMEKVGMCAKCHGRLRKKAKVLEVADYGRLLSFFPFLYLSQKSENCSILHQFSRGLVKL